MKAGPLAGRRIVVTRAQRQSGSLHERLEQEGADVLLVPMIETVPPDSYVPLDTALREAASYEWLVVTSPNAVRAIEERLHVLEIPVKMLRHLRVAAVGPATAHFANQVGLLATLVPDQYVGEALAEVLAPQVKGSRVLVVRGAAARDFVPTALTAAGAQVTAVEAYQTVMPADAVERARGAFSSAPLPDAVVFTSTSTVEHLLTVLRKAELALPPAVACVSIGPVTSEALRQAGLVVAAQAKVATLDRVVEACVRLFAQK